MLHLFDADGKFLKAVSAGGWFTLPDGNAVSPAYAGWSGPGGFELRIAPSQAAPAPVDPDEGRASMRLSFAQLMIGLVTEGWITEADGEAWLGGTLPPTVLATINLIPADQRFAAKAKAARPSYVARLDPLVVMMSMAQGRSAAEVDEFFSTYSAV